MHNLPKPPPYWLCMQVNSLALYEHHEAAGGSKPQPQRRGSRLGSVRSVQPNGKVHDSLNNVDDDSDADWARRRCVAEAEIRNRSPFPLQAGTFSMSSKSSIAQHEPSETYRYGSDNGPHRRSARPSGTRLSTARGLGSPAVPVSPHFHQCASMSHTP